MLGKLLLSGIIGLSGPNYENSNLEYKQGKYSFNRPPIAAIKEEEIKVPKHFYSFKRNLEGNDKTSNFSIEQKVNLYRKIMKR